MDLLAHLRGLVAVADEMNVTAAADALEMDQPLLSRRIRALEAHLDVQLLDRSRRQIELTSAAAALLPSARQLIAQADQLVRSARPEATTFDITVPADADPGALGRLLSLLCQLEVDPVVRSSGTLDHTSGGAWLIESSAAAAATWLTPLGVTSSDDIAGAKVDLVDLRPRRRGAAVPLLVSDVDRAAPWFSAFSAAADRAGIPPTQLEAVADLAVATGRVLAGQARFVCDAGQAARRGLRWSALAATEAVRGHRLVEQAPLPAALSAGPDRAIALDLVAQMLCAS